jgi:predicted  nucleic acid-binding Zn-ribbon protein
MNDADKILQAIARLQEGQKSLQAAIDQQGKAVKAMQEDISGVKPSLAHTNTAIKALPTKKEAEEIVDTAVDAAKSELKADIADAKGELKSDILMLNAKVVRKIPSLERRVTNVEEHVGIESPEKH